MCREPEHDREGGRKKEKGGRRKEEWKEKGKEKESKVYREKEQVRKNTNIKTRNKKQGYASER